MTSQQRAWLYGLLIVISASLALAKIVSANVPQGYNDRSRWLTARALVEHGTFELGRRAKIGDSYQDTWLYPDRGWRTIDVYLHPDDNYFVSDKPPILSALVALFYWPLYSWFFFDFSEFVGRALLVVINLLPFIFYLLLISRLVERNGRSDWAKMFTVAAASFGTFVSAFTSTLNNHTFAAFCVMGAVYLFVRIWCDDVRQVRHLVGLGFFAGLAAVMDLPSACVLAVTLSLVFLRYRWHGVVKAASGAVVPIGAFAILSSLAYGTWLPPFGERWGYFPGSYWLNPVAWDKGQPSVGLHAFHTLIGHHGLLSLTPIFLLSLAGLFLPNVDESDSRWRSGAKVLAAGTATITASCMVHQWTWAMGLRLLPVLPLAAVIIVRPNWLWAHWSGLTRFRQATTQIGFICLIATLCFYLTNFRNYGGVTAGPRFLLWLSPILALAMLPVVERWARSKWGRGFAYALLAVSILSVASAGVNPWIDPWPVRMFDLRP